MTERFYSPADLTGPKVELTGAEAHHLLHVLRLQTGDKVCLFDGAGVEAAGVVIACSRQTATLRIDATRTLPPQAGPQVVLGTAVPKGDRFRWLAEKATELGVNRLVPLTTARSVVDPGPGKLEKLRQTVIAASKQCGRSHLMHIAPTTTWNAFIEQEFSGQTAYVAHFSGEPLSVDLADRARKSDNAVILAVGPEGGFTADEIDRAVRVGWTPVNLGPCVLRIETAAVALAVLFGLGASLSRPGAS